jgi:hypothetical protein
MHDTAAVSMSARMPCGSVDQDVPAGMSAWAWNADKGLWQLIGCNCPGKCISPPDFIGRKGQVSYTMCFEVAASETGDSANADVETLSDDDLLELCQSRLSPADQDALSDLLSRQDDLSVTDQARLDELMRLYRDGLVRKARALKEAVDRGLVPELNSDGG